MLLMTIYLTGVVISAVACAYTSPTWLHDGEPGSTASSSAVLVAGLLWPLLLLGLVQVAIVYVLQRAEHGGSVNAPVTSMEQQSRESVDIRV